MSTHPTFANGLQLVIHDGTHSLVIDYRAQLFLDGAYAQYGPELMVDDVIPELITLIDSNDGAETELASIGHAAESPHVSLTEARIIEMLEEHATNRINENALDCAEIFI